MGSFSPPAPFPTESFLTRVKLMGLSAAELHGNEEKKNQKRLIGACSYTWDMFLGFTLEVCTGLMRGATVKPSRVLKGENRRDILDSKSTLDMSRLHSVQRHFFLIRQGSDTRCWCCNFKAESSCICCLLPACPLSSSSLFKSPSINLQRIKKKIGVYQCPYGAPKF